MTNVILERPEIIHIEIPIRGTAPLICHRWSEKAKKEILDKHMKKASKGRDAKDPERDYQESLYKLPGDKFGFPSIAFKAAMVRAGTYADMKMTFLRGAFHLNSEFVEIQGVPRMREDMVRVSMTVDIRYRGEFPEWQAILPISYNAKAISLEQIFNLVMIAGFAVGVGEWRPERDGQFGTFELIGG
jgi:hypothetical protein